MKIERAQTHLNNLRVEVEAFHGRKPYRIIADNSSEPGKILFRVKIIECVPAGWSAIIGDIIHNLRSSLDLLATALVVANGGNPKTAYFPFAKIPGDIGARVNERMRGASPKAMKFARRLKPHPGGNEALWMLHSLDLLDKHRSIIPVGAAHRSVNPDLASNVPTKGEAEEITKLWEAMRSFLKERPIFLRPADRQFPMQDGAVLFSCPTPEPGQPKPEPQFIFEVAFGEGQVVDGEPVVETLKNFVKLAERITKIAQRHFF